MSSARAPTYRGKIGGPRGTRNTSRRKCCPIVDTGNGGWKPTRIVEREGWKGIRPAGPEEPSGAGVEEPHPGSAGGGRLGRLRGAEPPGREGQFLDFLRNVPARAGTP